MIRFVARIFCPDKARAIVRALALSGVPRPRPVRAARRCGYSSLRIATGVSAALAAPAVVAEMPSPGSLCPKPGVTVRTNQGLEVKFQGAAVDDPEVCVWDVTTAAGQKGTYQFLYNIFRLRDDNRLNNFMRQAYRGVFPLAAGNSVSQLVSGSEFNTSMRFQLTVEGPVSVPVGSAKRSAWLIRAKGTGSFDSGIEMDNRYWLDTETLAPLRKVEEVNGTTDAYDVIQLLVAPTSQKKTTPQEPVGRGQPRKENHHRLGPTTG